MRKDPDTTKAAGEGRRGQNGGRLGPRVPPSAARRCGAPRRSQAPERNFETRALIAAVWGTLPSFPNPRDPPGRSQKEGVFIAREMYVLVAMLSESARSSATPSC